MSVRTITHIDLNRSILWTYENSEQEELCRLLTNLYLWSIDGKIHLLTDEEIIRDIHKVIKNYNKTSVISSAITEVKVLKRDRVDDLIY